MFLFAFELKRRSGNIKHMYLTFNGIGKYMDRLWCHVNVHIPVGVLKVHWCVNFLAGRYCRNPLPDSFSQKLYTFSGDNCVHIIVNFYFWYGTIVIGRNLSCSLFLVLFQVYPVVEGHGKDTPATQMHPLRSCLLPWTLLRLDTLLNCLWLCWILYLAPLSIFSTL